MKRLHDVFICPICGMPMIHYRLRGYQCANEEHNTRRQMEVAQAIMSPHFDDAYCWCIGNDQSGFHAKGSKYHRKTLCGAIISTSEPEKVSFRRPTCVRCVELLLEKNSHTGE